MRVTKTYIAFDDTPFQDRFACARWDFHVRPDMLERLAEAFGKRHISEQGRWCGGDPELGQGGYACGCMGCANHTFYDLDLQYEHWQVWFHELRLPQTTDNIPDVHSDVDVILTDIGPNRVEVFKVVRALTGLGLLETKKLMETPNAVLKTAVQFYDGNYTLEQLENVGATVKLEVSDKQRWTRIS